MSDSIKSDSIKSDSIMSDNTNQSNISMEELMKRCSYLEQENKNLRRIIAEMNCKNSNHIQPIQPQAQSPNQSPDQSPDRALNQSMNGSLNQFCSWSCATYAQQAGAATVSPEAIDDPNAHDANIRTYLGKKGSRDTTKYIFNGGKYNKRDLVYACLKYFVDSHPQITLQELKGLFPDYLQGSFGVFKTATDLQMENRNAKYMERFFDTPLEIEGEKAYVCSEWNKENIEQFYDKMLENGLDIKKVDK